MIDAGAAKDDGKGKSFLQRIGRAMMKLIVRKTADGFLRIVGLSRVTKNDEI